MKNNKLLKLAVLAMLVALGVVISPILRFEGMCPMAHFINIVCGVLLGPWYSLLCALLIGIIRMAFLGIPPIALTGAIFGAFLSGICYRASKGNLVWAVIGEIVGTGIIGAILSYPVMTIFWGKEGLTWLFYIPSFVCGTLIGGSIAFVFLRKLANAKVLCRFQNKLGTNQYDYHSSLLGDALSIASLGIICFLVIKILCNIFSLTSALTNGAAYCSLGGFVLAGLIYYIAKKVKQNGNTL